MPEESNETRLAVLEAIAEGHEKRITSMEEFHRQVIDRFDQKMHSDTSNQIALERNIAKATSQLELIAQSLPRITELATEAHLTVTKHEAVAKTVMAYSLVVVKILGAISVVVGAAWAVYTTFFA